MILANIFFFIIRTFNFGNYIVGNFSLLSFAIFLMIIGFDGNLYIGSSRVSWKGKILRSWLLGIFGLFFFFFLFFSFVAFLTIENERNNTNSKDDNNYRSKCKESKMLKSLSREAVCLGLLDKVNVRQSQGSSCQIYFLLRICVNDGSFRSLDVPSVPTMELKIKDYT